MIANWPGRLFNVYPGEGRFVRLMLLYSFFIGVIKVYFATAASALFLTSFVSADIAYIYIAAGLVVIIIGAVTGRLQRVLSPPRLLALLLLFQVLYVLGAWLGVVQMQAAWLVFSLLVLYRISHTLMNFSYWNLAGYLFDVRQSKRLFGLISSGEMVARIALGFSLPLVVARIGTVNLLLVAAAALAGCLLIQVFINWRDGAAIFAPVHAARQQPTRPDARPTGLARLLRQPYILLMLGFFMLLTFTYYMVEFLLLDGTQRQVSGAGDIAGFLGVFLGGAQLAVLVMKTFFSGRLLGRFGVRLGLLAHPTVYLLVFGALLLVGIRLGLAADLFFALVLVSKISEQTLDHGLTNPSFRVLYKPLPPKMRAAVQSLIEVNAGPLAVSAAGLVLLLVGQVVDALFIVGLTLALSVIWLVIGLLLNRAYQRALTTALTRRLLSGADLVLEDARTIAVLKARLDSGYPGEVIYALDILEDFADGAAYLPPLLTHPSPEVRRYVLERLEARHYPVPADDLRALINSDPDAAVRTAALRAFCTLYPTQAVETLTGYLDAADTELRSNAMVGLMRADSDAGFTLVREHLATLTDSADPADRVFAARVLGEAAQPDFVDLLRKLIDDPVVTVRQAALLAAGKINNTTLLPHIIAGLHDPATRQAAADALVQIDGDVTGALADVFARDEALRPVVVSVLGQRGDPPAIAYLRDHLATDDRLLRARLAAALGRVGYRAEGRDAAAITRLIENEVNAAARLLALRRALSDEDAVALVRAALDTTLRHSQRRVLLLLALCYDPVIVTNARATLEANIADRRAYALEALDVLLPNMLRTPVFALLERERQPQRLIAIGTPARYNQTTALHTLIVQPGHDTTHWLQTTAIHAAGRLGLRELLPQVNGAASVPHPVVRETVAWTQQQLNSSSQQNGANMLLTVEKVIILKTVDLFASLEDHVLVQIAALLHELYLEDGDPIFSKGDVGDCMYIIVEGRVRIHDGHRTLNELGAREVFGELALLDADVRSASATTRAPTTLLRLDQAVFYELLADHSDIAQGIIRVLSRRLRAAFRGQVIDPKVASLLDSLSGD